MKSRPSRSPPVQYVIGEACGIQQILDCVRAVEQQNTLGQQFHQSVDRLSSIRVLRRSPKPPIHWK
jgi:hypothetical protein